MHSRKHGAGSSMHGGTVMQKRPEENTAIIILKDFDELTFVMTLPVRMIASHNVCDFHIEAS